MRAAVLVLVLVCTGAAGAGELPYGDDGYLSPSGGGSRIPGRMLKLDGADGGVLSGAEPFLFSVRLANVTYAAGRARFGVAGVDYYMCPDDWEASMLLPVHVGCTLWSNPHRTAFFWSSVPDVYVEASAGLLTYHLYYAPSLRIALCCDVDYYGLGVRAEGGWLNLKTNPPDGDRESVFFFGVQIRALAFSLGPELCGCF
jgi:hypothetical protein